MNTFNNAVILSAERVGDLDSTSGFRTGVLEECLKDIKASYKQVDGVYTYDNGVRSEETSFLVEYDQNKNGDMLDIIKRFAFNQFDQESVLHLDSNRKGTLIYKDGRTKDLGRLISCDKDRANEVGSYTYTNGSYYIFEK